MIFQFVYSGQSFPDNNLESMKVIFLLISLSYIITTSKAIRCLTCNNARSNKHCKRIGRVVECQNNQQSCENEIRRNGRHVLITKQCKQSLACTNNFLQNDRAAWKPTQCNMKHAHTVCRCCCFEDKCNLDTHVCRNEKEKKIPDSIKGPGVCKPAHESLTNGLVRCTNTNKHGSVCGFVCNRGYRRVGEKKSSCGGNRVKPQWSSPAPVCQPIKCSPAEFPHLIANCTDENNIHSRCSLKCEDEQKDLIGQSVITCDDDGRWTPSLPTCKPTCRMDLVVALDNAVLIGSVADPKQETFYNNLERKFEKPDTKIWKISHQSHYVTEDNFRSKRSIIKTEPPKQGLVTTNTDSCELAPVQIGGSFKHMNDTIFKEAGGDRSNSPNVALIVTVGNPPDENEKQCIRIYSSYLREDNVKIFAVGIGSNEELTSTLNDITGNNPTRILQLTDHSDLLQQDILDRVYQMIFPQECLTEA